MRKSANLIGWLGLCGFLIGAALYVYSSLFNYTKPLTTFDVFFGVLAIVLCPPTLLFVLCIDCEIGGASGVIMFLLIGLMNAALYSAIGSLTLRLRRTPG
jgi:hypothetical protein